MMQGQWLTVSELSEKYGVHVEKVRRWIREGKINIRHDGKRKVNVPEFEKVFFNQKEEKEMSTIHDILVDLGIVGHEIKPGTFLTWAEVKVFTDNQSERGIRYRKDGEDLYVITNLNDDDGNVYHDRWNSERGILQYHGEGRSGDMKFTGGNLRLFNHYRERRPVQVIQKLAVNQYVYWGAFMVIGYFKEIQALAQEVREAIVFELAPILRTEESPGYSNQPVFSENKKTDIIAQLNTIQTDLSKEKVVTEKFSRSQKLVKLLKELYEYRCQVCDPHNPIPRILMKNGRYYVEVHHVLGFHEAANLMEEDNQETGDFLVDDISNTIVCCSQHHKFFHYYHSPLRYDKQENAFISEDGSITLPVYLKHPDHHLGGK